MDTTVNATYCFLPCFPKDFAIVAVVLGGEVKGDLYTDICSPLVG